MSNNQQDPTFEELLNYLKYTRGFDFTGYKRSSLIRLTKRRMQRVGVESFSDYLDYLEANAFEVNQLFDALLLNVTTFFRDLSAWNCLSQEVIPRILEAKAENEPIRVWSAGCASGEEAYTIAIILAEALGTEEFRARVKIYATDMDEDALNQGRLASYTLKQLRDIPDELRDKYFNASRNHYTFRSELRRCMIFGRNNLIQDAPIGHLDLLICRNVLMYFNAETQARVLSRFHFALNNNGFLFVGKAEMLLNYANLFTPVNLKHRIFAKLPKANLRDRLLLLTEVADIEPDNHLLKTMHLRDEAFECLPVAQIIVDVQCNLVLVNRQARVLLGLTLQDQGRPLQDLELSFRPAELRSRIQQAYAQRQPVQIENIELSTLANGTLIYLDIEIIPLMDTHSELLGAIVAFNDVTRYKQLQQELLRSTQELETAYKELQSTNEELETTNEELQSTNEELEATNEELQSTNEELETTNEELQTTNEELETMNEELHSSNKELQATNEELNSITQQLNYINAFMEAILTSLRMGMVVLDNRLSIQLWNGRAKELWGLAAEDVQGSFFFDLDIGLPTETFREAISACQSGRSDDQEVELVAVNRRGKTIRCRVICTPLIIEGLRQGIIMLMEERES